MSYDTDQSPPPPVITLHDRFRPVLALARNAWRNKARVTLLDVIQALGPGGIAIAVLLLAVPFISPISLGPATTIVSLFMIVVGYRIARGREDLPFPDRWMQFALPARFLHVMRRLVVRISRRKKWHLEPLPPETHGHQFRALCGWGIVVGGLLLAVPIPMLPLTNTFPALGIISFCLALLFQKWRPFFLGIVFCVAGVLVFAILIVVVLLIGVESIEHLRLLLKS